MFNDRDRPQDPRTISCRLAWCGWQHTYEPEHTGDGLLHSIGNEHLLREHTLGQILEEVAWLEFTLAEFRHTADSIRPAEAQRLEHNRMYLAGASENWPAPVKPLPFLRTIPRRPAA